MPRASMFVPGAVLAFWAGSVAAEVPAGIVFQPHRAVYDISLDRSTPGSSVAALDGRLVYEITGSSCEGYTQNMRFVTRSTNQEGQSQSTDLRTSSWEDVPSRRLRFSITNMQNGATAEQSQGDAKRGGPEAQASVALVKPAKKTVSVAAGVYFPIQHSMALLEAARSGKRLFAADLYDGSENGEKVFATSAVIGNIAAAGAVKMPAVAKDGGQLALVPSWPVTISYFENADAKSDTTPSYEMSYRFHENGVTSDLLIDHREFAFRGELKELEFLPQSKCGADQH